MSEVQYEKNPVMKTMLLLQQYNREHGGRPNTLIVSEHSLRGLKYCLGIKQSSTLTELYGLKIVLILLEHGGAEEFIQIGLGE